MLGVWLVFPPQGKIDLVSCVLKHPLLWGKYQWNMWITLPKLLAMNSKRVIRSICVSSRWCRKEGQTEAALPPLPLRCSILFLLARLLARRREMQSTSPLLMLHVHVCVLLSVVRYRCPRRAWGEETSQIPPTEDPQSSLSRTRVADV